VDAGTRIELALERAIAHATDEAAPPKLAEAVRHALFSGGARVRPRLALAVAAACGGGDSQAAEGVAVALEMLHGASLVHDDMPCFDDAATRRGKPSVHAVFGAPIALLAGDALIVLAFETLVKGSAGSPELIAPLMAAVTRGVGMPFGIVAGQAWESEPNPPAERYRCAKTGALFVAATTAGAIAGGGDPRAWRALGHCLGEAYQVADDLLDAVSAASECDKPVGRDAALGRPSAVTELGLGGAVRRLGTLVEDAVASIPACAGDTELKELVRMQAVRLAPKRLLESVAA